MFNINMLNCFYGDNNGSSPENTTKSIKKLVFFLRCTALPALEAGWQQVRKNDGCAGGDGITIEEFSSGADFKLAILHKCLREGWYQPGPVRVIPIKKRGSSKMRVLRGSGCGRPDRADRCLSRADSRT